VELREELHEKGNIVGVEATKTQPTLRDRGTHFLPGNFTLTTINMIVPRPKKSSTNFIKVFNSADRHHQRREKM
jgi:hypothetical protein